MSSWWLQMPWCHLSVQSPAATMLTQLWSQCFLNDITQLISSYTTVKQTVGFRDIGKLAARWYYCSWWVCFLMEIVEDKQIAWLENLRNYFNFKFNFLWNYGVITNINTLNSSPPCAANMHQYIRWALVKIMACCRFGTKSLSKPMPFDCQYGPVTVIVPASGHQVRCMPWVQMGTFNKEIGFLCWLKFFALNIFCGEYLQSSLHFMLQIWWKPLLWKMCQ